MANGYAVSCPRSRTTTHAPGMDTCLYPRRGWSRQGHRGSGAGAVCPTRPLRTASLSRVVGGALTTHAARRVYDQSRHARRRTIRAPVQATWERWSGRCVVPPVSMRTPCLPNSARCDDQRVHVLLYHQGTGPRESKLILVLGAVALQWVAGIGVGEIRRTTPQVDVRKTRVRSEA
jgi:hypothetical protein